MGSESGGEQAFAIGASSNGTKCVICSSILLESPCEVLRLFKDPFTSL
jgi:hypothetical protein